MIAPRARSREEKFQSKSRFNDPIVQTFAKIKTVLLKLQKLLDDINNRYVITFRKDLSL